MKVEIKLTKDEKYEDLITISSYDGDETKCWITLSNEHGHLTVPISIEELKLALKKISLK
jgi:hypothetical protein